MALNDYPEPARRKQKEFNKCFLLNGSEQQYQDYKFLSENWICFSYWKGNKYVEEIFQTEELPQDVHLER